MHINKSLLLFSIITIAFSSSFAQTDVAPQTPKKASLEFPVITKNIDKHLFEGDKDSIVAYVEQRKVYIEQLTAQLKSQKNNVSLQLKNLDNQKEVDESGVVIDNLNNTDISSSFQELKVRHEELSETISNFKDIHYKHVNLIHELDGVDDVPIQKLEIKPPYSVFSPLDVNNFIEEMYLQQNTLQSQVKESTNRLSKLSDILSDLVVDYTIFLGKKIKSPQLYNALRSVYLYQADYAILQFKNKKYSKKLNYVVEQIQQNEKLLPIVIEKMVVNQEDLSTLAKALEKVESTYKKLQKEHIKLNKGFDKISLKAELDLDNLDVKIKNSSSDTEKNLLQVQRQLQLNKIKYTYFIKNLLQQKEQALQINQDRKTFDLTWMKPFGEEKNQRNVFKEIIKQEQAHMLAQENTKLENAQILDSLNRSTLELSGLQGQIDNTKKTATPKLKKQQSLLNKQIDKNLKTIQRLALQLNENNVNIDKSSNINNRVLKVLSQQMNKLERIGQWFGDKFDSQFDRVKNILYYPLTNFGDRPFTLAILLKTLLYLVLGIASLKFIRPRFTRLLTNRTKLEEGAAHSISTLLYYFGGLIVFLIALSASGFDLGQMMIVFGALGVGIGFGLQNIANNFVSGMILLIDRTLTVGDSITLGDGTHGKVSKLAMRYTVIRTNGGNDIIVPNSELIANRVTSMTFDDNYFRIEIPFGVGYDADPEQVREITLQVANKVKHTINRESQKSTVLFSGFGDNSLDFVLRVWVFIYDRYRPYAIKSDYYYKLFKAFKEAGIEIPYPQRDFHIRSIDDSLLSSIQKKIPKK